MTLNDIASVATALGVAFAGAQLVIMQRQSRAQFEDSLNAQYRSIVARIPLPALLGERLSEEELGESLRAFYDYFDLSNEQAFLDDQGRLSPSTWQNWHEGIMQHLERPAFAQAWQRLSPHLNGSFDELRQLLPARVE